MSSMDYFFWSLQTNGAICLANGYKPSRLFVGDCIGPRQVSWDNNMRLQIRESLYDNGDLKTHGTIVNSVKERVYTSYVLIFHPLTI